MKPTANELEMAIVAAEAMRESGADEHHVARTLLYLYQRLQELEIIIKRLQIVPCSARRLQTLFSPYRFD